METSETLDEGVKGKNEEMKLNVKRVSKWSDAKDLVIMTHKTNTDKPMRGHACVVLVRVNRDGKYLLSFPITHIDSILFLNICIYRLHTHKITTYHTQANVTSIHLETNTLTICFCR